MRNLDEYISNYLLYCKYQKALDSKTLKAYGIDLSQFSDFLSKRGYEINRESITSYISYLHQNFKIKSVKRKLASIKAFLNHLEYEEIITDNPFSKMRIKLHEPFLLPRTIPFSSIEILLKCLYQQKNDTTKTQYKHNAILRDIAIIELLFATGMRVSELCSLKKSDVNFFEGTIKIFGKGSKERLIQIGNKEVLTSLEAYAKTFKVEIENTGWFFINRLGQKISDQSVRLMINRYVSLAGLSEHITPHMFRHSFATLLLEEDVDIRYIQQLLGHSSIMTTQIYTHVTSKKQRDLLTTKHPRNKISV